METARYFAVKTLLDNGINSLPLLSHNIEEMIIQQGFKIIAYNLPITKEDRRDFESLGILNIAMRHPAFTYVSEDKQIVFHRSDLSAQQRTRLLAHELGHITLQHFSLYSVRCSSALNTPQEREAETFAIELLAPTCVLKTMRSLSPEDISHTTLVNIKDAQRIYLRIQKHTNNTEPENKLYVLFRKRKQTTNKYLIFTFLALSALLFVIGTQDYIITTDTILAPTVSPIVTISPEEVTDTVVFTKSGTKYHKSDCYHIKNRTTFKTTIEEAIKQGLEPCKTCF